MITPREIRWRIDGAFTAETMPLDRLAEYLKELATMLGEEKSLHLIRVESSSTVPIIRVDDDAVERVHQRGHAVRSGMAPQSAMQSYRKINKMLQEDKATAVLYEKTAEIIPFPGGREPEPVISGIQQQGTLDGKLEKIGGSKEWVPIHLQTQVDEPPLTGCFARRHTAKDMGHHLFSPIRVYGRGRWSRSPEGRWTIERFWVDSFEPLDPTPLIEVVAALRSIPAQWSPNPIAGIHALRNGSGEDG